MKWSVARVMTLNMESSQVTFNTYMEMRAHRRQRDTWRLVFCNLHSDGNDVADQKWNGKQAKSGVRVCPSTVGNITASRWNIFNINKQDNLVQFLRTACRCTTKFIRKTVE